MDASKRLTGVFLTASFLVPVPSLSREWASALDSKSEGRTSGSPAALTAWPPGTTVGKIGAEQWAEPNPGDSACRRDGSQGMRCYSNTLSAAMTSMRSRDNFSGSVEITASSASSSAGLSLL